MSDGLIIFLVVLGVVVAIALIAFLIYLYLKPRLRRDDKPTEEQIVHEELERYLKPIEDEEVAKKVEQYKDDKE